MAEIPYGNRRADILTRMSQRDRLAFISEGLPIITASARNFWDAARQLEDGSREQSVLEGFAIEEAAKILILMDLVRCPAKHVSRRVKGMVKTFYDHLGRMIYADAQGWRVSDVTELQGGDVTADGGLRERQRARRARQAPLLHHGHERAIEVPARRCLHHTKMYIR